MNGILYEREQLKNIRNSFGCGMTLIQLAVNMPGSDKKAYPGMELFGLGAGTLVVHLGRHNIKLEDVLFMNGSLGMMGFFKVNEKESYIKQISIELEQNNPLSKYWDIDVYNGAGEKISRKMLQQAPRKCFICDKTAKECGFLQTHPTEELLKKMIKDYNEFLKSPKGV